MQNLQSLLELIPKPELQELKPLAPEGETPIWQHWEEFVMQYHRLGRSLLTIRSVRDGIRVLIRNTRVCSIEQLNDPKLLTQITLDMQEKYGLQSNTRNTYIKNLNTYFIWLEKNEYIAENRVRKAPKSAPTFNEKKCLNNEQVLKLFEYLRTRKFSCKLERLRTLLYVEVLAFTGARPVELLAMQIDAIYQDDTGDWKIRINGKKHKGRPRYYDCPQYIAHRFLSYMQTRQESGRYEDALFISMSSFSGWTKSGVDSFFKRLSAEIGFRISSYPFRRYVATHLNAQGISIKDIGRHLGHLKTSTTELYIERSGILTNTTSKAMELANQLNSSGAFQSLSRSVSLNRKDKSLLC